MILNKKLLNLLGILAIGSIGLGVAVAVDDLDDTLKQALFLVKLLKSDFTHILRTNNYVMAHTAEENSTCSLPSEEFNSTIAMNKTEVTAWPVTPSTTASPPPPTPDAPPAPPNIMPPGAPMIMPYASWTPMPMGYPPPSGPRRQNFPDENYYRFPYRLNRRRMMPDYYYYFDSPARSLGNFRRYNNDPADDPPATSQAQTISSLSAATSEATTLHVEETTASTTSLPTTRAQPSTSILPTTEQPILQTTTSANHTILPTTEGPNLPTVKLSKQPKHRKRVRHRTRVPVSKATTTVMSTRNENRLNVSRYHLRHHAHHTTTTEKCTKDVEMSQVASELEKELEGTNTEETHASYKDGKHQNLKKRIKKTTTSPRASTTMKVFLQGSSRIPIPFPENNGFCHFHPENALCGTM